MGDIIKTELLWSRDCSAKCVGCGMVQNVVYPPLDLSQWERGFTALRAHGNEFVAIYGAEPLLRQDGLLDIIRIIRSLGMECTILTTILDRPFLSAAIKAGLNSLTVSYDGQGDRWRAQKMHTGDAILEAFDVDDKACVMTIGAFNEDRLIDTAEEILSQDRWLLFDLLHSWHPFGKCTGVAQQVSPEKLQAFLTYLLPRKRDGEKIHPSMAYLTYLASSYQGDVRSVWHCRDKTLGWVTVDYDGEVLPCDDFQTRSGIKVWELYTRWDEFIETRHASVTACEGCAWNTHFDAVDIVTTQHRGTYIHTHAI